MGGDLKFYISVFFRRFHYFALVAITLTTAGIATAIILPTKYEADALLLVESPQIPDELAASTVSTTPREQLQIIEQRLLTRSNLLDIADANDVFSDRRELYPDEIVERMRNNTDFRISTGQDQASLVTILFTAQQPTTAAAVVNDYVTRVLESNVELRTNRAEGTMEFFEQEVARLAEDLARKSAQILDFKNANLDSLPENLEYQLSRLDDLRDRQSDISREVAELGRQRERLIVVFNATGGLGQSGQDLRSPKQKELDAAESELADALTIYSEQNPRIVALRAKIENLRAAVEREGDDTAPTEGEDPGRTMLNLQLDEIDSRVARLQNEAEALATEIAKLETSVDEIPSNSVALEGLMRDYENIQSQYNRAVQNASAAATGERIELTSKGERIAVISQPVVPREPSSPNRPLIAGGGLAAGLLGGIGVVVLLELLNRSIRRPVDLTRALGITPLATLPMMRTPREVAMRRLIVASAILAGAIGISAAVFYTHTQLMPLDLIASRAMDRIGL